MKRNRFAKESCRREPAALRRFRSGESLVEVMVSAVIFLMMAAVLQGAISFCGSALQKNRQLRKTNAEICEKLREELREQPESVGSAGTADYQFNAISADGNHTGTEVLFQIKVPLGKKAVSYQDEGGGTQTVTFDLFGPVSPTGGGGP